MEMWYWVVLDLSLLLLVTLRLTRLATTDSIGQWWFYAPLYKKFVARPGPTSKWAKYVDGIACPFCIGFWIGVLAVISLYLVGGVGDAAEWWRWTAGVFALNYIVGHVSAWLD